MMENSKPKKVLEYLKSNHLTKLEKEQLIYKYPNAIFSNENEPLDEYIDRLLELYFPIELFNNGTITGRDYIKEGILYLIPFNNHHISSPTKDIYPHIAKNLLVSPDKVERAIRYVIDTYFVYSKKEINMEIFSLPENYIPTNFYFLINLTIYIKNHYYFINNKKNSNALNEIDNFELKKYIQYCMFNYLGHFRYMTTDSQGWLIELIYNYLKNDIADYKFNECIQKIYKGVDNKQIKNIYRAINAINANAWNNRDVDKCREIFGDVSKIPTPKKYILTVSDYIKKTNGFIH